MTTEVEPIEAEVISRDLVPAPPPPALFGTTEPTEVIERATKIANALKTVVDTQKLYSLIPGRQKEPSGQWVTVNRKYVRVEGWTTLGAMLGVFPVEVWCRKLEDGWEARVEARTLTGAVVGAAEAECTRAEKSWADRDDYALRSMAQTRATSKAMRLPLGWVMTLAGFEATPEEEMPRERHDDEEEKRPYRPQGVRQYAPKAQTAVARERAKILGDDVMACESCHAPAGKPHATKCPNHPDSVPFE